MSQNFQEKMTAGYTFVNGGIPLGKAVLNGEILTETAVNIPTSTLNRHGLIAGATGTGKTKTIQKLLEWLSLAGIPSVMMDIKGDISGMAMPGGVSEKLSNYIAKLGNPTWQPQGFPTEFFSLAGEGGSQIRATISEFGPMLLSRVLGLSDVQESTLTIIFKFADDNGLLLVDLDDLKSLLSYISNDGKAEIENYGNVSAATIAVIMRQIIALESQWAKEFFGEKSLEIEDLMKIDDTGKWQINVIRLMNSLRSPTIFSTMMIQILVELFNSLPEVGDKWKPKLVLVIDEAHLLFRDLSPAMLAEIEVIMKLIRSKGVGILFCTQNPVDIPEIILSQLGLKIQHALRAFTAKDQDAIKKMAKNFPISDDYDIDDMLMNLGIGEAFITAIGEDGRPTPLVVAQILPPESRMDVITDAELASLLSISPLFMKYKNALNPESAAEFLTLKMQKIAEQRNLEELEKQRILAEKERKKNPTMMDSMIESATKSIGTNIARQIGKKIGGTTGGNIGADIVRGILGSIFK